MEFRGHMHYIVHACGRAIARTFTFIQAVVFIYIYGKSRYVWTQKSLISIYMCMYSVLHVFVEMVRYCTPTRSRHHQLIHRFDSIDPSRDIYDDRADIILPSSLATNKPRCMRVNIFVTHSN